MIELSVVGVGEKSQQGLEDWETLKGGAGSVYVLKIFGDLLKWSLIP